MVSRYKMEVEEALEEEEGKYALIRPQGQGWHHSHSTADSVLNGWVWILNKFLGMILCQYPIMEGISNKDPIQIIALQRRPIILTTSKERTKWQRVFHFPRFLPDVDSPTRCNDSEAVTVSHLHSSSCRTQDQHTSGTLLYVDRPAPNINSIVCNTYYRV